MEAWKTIDSTYPFRDRWLTLRSDTVLLPNGQTLSPYHTIEEPDAANVVAISDQGSIVLIEQYRHPVQCTTLEIPAGHIEATEVPEVAARRELFEETGYSGGVWHELGPLYPYASRLANQIWSYLAVGVARTGEQMPDHGEVIRVREIPVHEFVAGLRAGTFVLPEANQLAAVFLAHMFASHSDDPRLATFKF